MLTEGSSLSIESYFRQIGELIEACAIVQSSNVTYDKRTLHTGFIRGELFLSMALCCICASLWTWKMG
jgi:hypothetical protein